MVISPQREIKFKKIQQPSNLNRKLIFLKTALHFKKKQDLQNKNPLSLKIKFTNLAALSAPCEAADSCSQIKHCVNTVHLLRSSQARRIAEGRSNKLRLLESQQGL